MVNQASNLHGGGALRRSSGAGERRGVAKDQLIFIIICSAALVVAAVTLVHFFTGGSKVRPSAWQCVDCNHEFTMKKVAVPPVKCPKCGGEAVRLGYRVCRACGERVLVCRVRMSEQGQAPAGPAGGPPGLGMMQPMDIQYRIKQDDGSFAWSPWMLGGSPQAMQLDRALVCPECGESLSPLSPSR